VLSPEAHLDDGTFPQYVQIVDRSHLGETIEAGLVVQELLLRHRARTAIIVCPAGPCLEWQDEMEQKFGLHFEIVNSQTMKDVRRSHGDLPTSGETGWSRQAVSTQPAPLGAAGVGEMSSFARNSLATITVITSALGRSWTTRGGGNEYDQQ